MGVPIDILRTAVAIADSVTKDWQPSVTFKRYLRSDATGKRSYAADVFLLRAIVELKQRQVRTQQGELAVSSITITFLDVAAVLAATVDGVMTVNDVIVLATGQSTPIMGVGGFIDAGTGAPVATEAYCG